MAEQKELEQLASLQKVRKVVVYLALGLLLVSYFKPNGVLSIARSLLWAAAGVVSLVEARSLQKVGAKPGNAYMNAAIYMGLAVLVYIFAR
jgi:hypothetical protein